MADRRVTHADRDNDGDVRGICWNDGGRLLYTARPDAIAEIESHINRYYVAEEAPAVWLLVRVRNGVKYLTTEADSTSRNNLDNLPACSRG